MAIDLSQFHEVFFEESFEGLDTMEAELLQLQPDAVDLEVINTIFRAAHSIKGGSSTFSFPALTDLTHELETLLDQVRQQTISITTEHINLLLQSVDCTRELLSAYQNKTPPSLSGVNALLLEFAKLNGTEPEQMAAMEQVPKQESIRTYTITFKPTAGLFKTGNDPLYIIDDLADLGTLETRVFCDRLPSFNAFKSDECYLHWQLKLTTEQPLQAIEEVFEWVIDEAEISITELAVQQVQRTTPSIAKSSERKAADTSSIRVSVNKIDTLINMTGELVTSQNALNQYLNQELTPESIGQIQQSLALLAKTTHQLQENILRTRMLPISLVFSRFSRLVHDYSQQHNKKIELKLAGEQSELDKNLIERITDPIVHLVRNSLDHGIETIPERLAKQKNPCGVISLNAYHQAGSMVIEVADDGKGFDSQKIRHKAIEHKLVADDEALTEEQIYELLFIPGFSTASHVSNVSGRGVGMDVVKRNIESLHGSLQVSSELDVGVKFTIKLPLTMAILEGQLITCAEQTYVLALTSIVETTQVAVNKLKTHQDNSQTIEFRGEEISVCYLAELFNLSVADKSAKQILMIVVEAENERFGIVVDDFLGQQQVVVKSIEENYKAVLGITGATILSNGNVALIIDVIGLLKLKQHTPVLTSKQIVPQLEEV